MELGPIFLFPVVCQRVGGYSERVSTNQPKGSSSMRNETKLAATLIGAELLTAGLFITVPFHAGTAYAQPSDVVVPGYDFSQEAFPCQEDEVLGYAPQFGPDRVGCIHIDVLVGAR